MAPLAESIEFSPEQICEFPVILMVGTDFIVIAKILETPEPFELLGVTLRLPDVALLAKLILTVFPVPTIVAPVPEYAQV